jgi:hypothetical protein
MGISGISGYFGIELLRLYRGIEKTLIHKLGRPSGRYEIIYIRLAFSRQKGYPIF